MTLLTGLLALSACSGFDPAPAPQPVVDPDPKPQPEPDPQPQPEPEPEVEELVERLSQPRKIDDSDFDPTWRPPTNVSQPDYPTPTVDSSMCDDLEDGGPLAEGSDCITAEIKCGESVVGHTVGGVERYDTKFYEKKMCWPATKDHDGGDERIYKLVMPDGEWRAFVTLYSPCADLDLAGIRSDHTRTCPTMSTSINQCEMSVWEDTKNERIELTSQTKKGRNPVWYIVVEGKDYPGEPPNEGPFELYVQCWPGLGGRYDR